MTYTRVAIMLSSAIILAACGGSGNSDQTIPQNEGNVTPGSNIPAVNPPADHIPLIGKIADPNGGSYVRIDKGSNRYSVDVQSGGDINTLIINGQPVVLHTGNNSQIIADNLRFARYGFIHNYPENAGYFIARGIPTMDMPYTGKAIYKGYAVHGQQNRAQVTRGTSMFSVDFADRTLAGSITGNSFEPFTLRAKINGNTFSGQHNNIDIAGQFYGNNAAELAGTYTNGSKTIAGAFGAAKE